MAAGHPLDDADRQPWLETLNRLMRVWFEAGVGGVLACSALKAKYRETLAAAMPPGTIHFILLEGSPQLIAERLAARKHEYMNPNLLASQLKTLEPPSPGEAISVVNDRTPDEVVDEILRQVNPQASS